MRSEEDVNYGNPIGRPRGHAEFLSGQESTMPQSNEPISQQTFRINTPLRQGPPRSQAFFSFHPTICFRHQATSLIRNRLMSLRARSTPSATAASAVATTEDAPETPKPQPPQRSSSSSSLSQRALSQTLTSTANLANLLPTGTLLAFQLLTPVFTNNGSCDAATRPMTILLLAILAISCFLACFTDSVKLSDGRVYYGFATFRGMWLFDTQGAIAGSGVGVPDLSKYRLGFIDWVHSILSVLVFAAVALRDKNVVGCFYPKPDHEVQEVLDIVPVGIGFLCSLLFLVFPTRRHGIGYPVTPGN